MIFKTRTLGRISLLMILSVVLFFHTTYAMDNYILTIMVNDVIVEQKRADSYPEGFRTYVTPEMDENGKWTKRMKEIPIKLIKRYFFDENGKMVKEENSIMMVVEDYDLDGKLISRNSVMRNALH